MSFDYATLMNQHAMLQVKCQHWQKECMKLKEEIDQLRAELAAIMASEPFAWAEFDGEGGYDLRLYEYNETFHDEYIKRNGEKYRDWVKPLYTTQQPQPDVQELVEALEACLDYGSMTGAEWVEDKARAALSAYRKA